MSGLAWVDRTALRGMVVTVAIIPLSSMALGKHTDPRVKICQVDAREHGSSDRMERGAEDQQAAPLFLDAVMYFQPGLRAHDVSGDQAGKLSTDRNRRGAWEPGVIEPCRNLPRYY